MIRFLASILLLLLVSGCGTVARLLHDPITDVEERLGVPVQIVAEDQFPGGRVTFYTFTDGKQCGEGYVIKGSNGGGGGSAARPCNGPQEPFDVGVGGSGRDSGALAVLYGRISDPRITRILVTLQGRAPTEARVVHGLWYLLLPGVAPGPGLARALPDIERIVGLDATGAEVHRFEPASAAPKQ